MTPHPKICKVWAMCRGVSQPTVSTKCNFPQKSDYRKYYGEWKYSSGVLYF